MPKITGCPSRSMGNENTNHAAPDLSSTPQPCRVTRPQHPHDCQASIAPRGTRNRWPCRRLVAVGIDCALQPHHAGPMGRKSRRPQLAHRPSGVEPSNRSIELHGIQIEEDSWMAITDTIACTGISWTKGVLHVDRIHLGTLDVTQTSNPSMKVAPSTRTLNSIGNPFGQAPSWGRPSSSGLGRNPHWRTQQPRSDHGPRWVHWIDVQCSRRRPPHAGMVIRQWQPSSMEFPMELDASSLHGTWSPRGWDVQTETLSLPGLDFEGTLVWPEMTGGRRRSRENLPSWVRDLEPQGWLDTLQLNGETTSLAWDLNGHPLDRKCRWPQIRLSIWASGNANEWRQAQIDHIPPSFKSAILSDTLKLNAKGTQHSMDLRLTGGPEVDARGCHGQDGLGNVALAAPGVPEHVQVFIDAWGPWVSGPSERIEATIEGEGDSLHLALGQPDFELPWSMKGVLDGHALMLRRTWKARRPHQRGLQPFTWN